MYKGEERLVESKRERNRSGRETETETDRQRQTREGGREGERER